MSGGSSRTIDRITLVWKENIGFVATGLGFSLFGSLLVLFVK